MKYLIIILLIGIALYFAMRWQKPVSKKSTSGNSDDNPNAFKPGNHTSSSSKSGNGPYQTQGQPRGIKSKINYGKWVGGGLGWALGGPIGGILGFMFGSMFDGMNSGQAVPGQSQTRMGDFNISLLILTAAVMKADGSVKRSELDFVKRYFITNFGQDLGKEYIKMLGEILKQDINVSEVSSQIGRYMDYSSKLLLLQYLFGVAIADGKNHPTEVNMINSISISMGVGSNDFESIKAMFIKDTNSAYKILEIDSAASNEELKRAYRELAKKYHPDKVSHLGEDVKLAAEQKFTKLNAAYEAVKQERGLN